MPLFDTVLLLDDSEPDNFINADLLRSKKAVRSVIVYEYAEDALRFLKTAGRPTIDLIIVDINMPRMDGFEFADAFHALYPELKANTKLVMLSGSLNPNDQRRALSHPGIMDYAVKPLGLDQLQQWARAHETNA